MTATACLPKSTVPPRKASRLLYCGLVAGPVFIVGLLLEGAIHGGGYEVLRHPVSSLALGKHGWMQTTNFLLGGSLSVAFAIGLWRSRRAARAGAALIAVWGVGLVGAGIFTTDPVSGYPAGSADAIAYTTHGALHDGFAIPGFLALAAAQLVLVRGQNTRWAVYSVVSFVVFIAAFFLASAAFSQTAHLVEIGGLFQRITVTVGWGWTVAVARQSLPRR
jgi:hypothetical protein